MSGKVHPLRIERAGAIYQVMAGGIARRNFGDDPDPVKNRPGIVALDTISVSHYH